MAGSTCIQKQTSVMSPVLLVLHPVEVLRHLEHAERAAPLQLQVPCTVIVGC